MAARGRAFHKPKPQQEERRKKEFGALVKKKRDQLGLTQKQLGALVDVSQPHIHRIEQEASWSPRFRLEALADALKLEGQDRVEYFTCAGYVIDPSLGQGHDDRLLAVFSDYPKTVYRVRVQGTPALTVGMGDQFSGRIQQELASSTLAPEYKNALRKIRARVLYEQSIALRESLVYEEVVEGTKQYFDAMLRIGEECEDDETLGLAHSSLSDSLYIAGKFDEAMEALSKVSELLMDPVYRLQAQRTRIMTWANMGDEKEIENAVEWTNAIIKDVPNPGHEEICQAYDGIARAYGRIKSPKAGVYLQKALAMYPQIEGAHLRGIQLVRTQLEVESIADLSDSEWLRPIGPEVLTLARPYPRYEWQIKELLDKRRR